jgi:hypothetical protein
MHSGSITPPSSPSIAPRPIGGMDNIADAVASPPLVVRRAKTAYHPIVSLMVESNTMRNCSQIQSMVSECHQMSNSSAAAVDAEPFVCRTAKKYHAMCLTGERS